MIDEGFYRPIYHLAKASWLSRWQSAQYLMLTSYFDETGDFKDTNQTVNGMAGWLAPAQNWDIFEGKWLEALSELQLSKGFHDLKIKKHNREVYRLRLLSILDEMGALPVGWLISTELLANVPVRTKKVFGDPYFRAFCHCLFYSSWFTHSEAEDGFSVVFATKPRFDPKAILFLNEFVEAFQFSLAGQRMSGYTFDSPTHRLPLQAADLLAGILRDEMRRRLTNPAAEPQKSFEAVQQIATKVHPNRNQYQLSFITNNEQIKAILNGETMPLVETINGVTVVTKNDGKEAERFEDFVKKLVNIPKEKLTEAEAKLKQAKKRC